MGYIVESLCSYFILLPLLFLGEIFVVLVYRKKSIYCSKGFLLGFQFLVCLYVAIFSITGTAGINDIGSYGAEIIRWDEVNLIPLRWGVEDSFGLIMNIILFMPLGALIPLLWENTSFFITTCSGFLFSLLIEISQLFNRRATDIDDLLMNTLGTIIGYVFYWVLLRRIRIFQVNCRSSKSYIIKYSPCFLLVLMFVIYFFIGHPFLRFVQMKMAYGF